MKETKGFRFIPSHGCAARLVLLVGCLLAGGCSGWAKLSLVPLNQTRISKTDPLVLELRPAECYYWIEDERITIALTDENISLTGEYGKKSLVGSIVLEGLPADQARDYRLNRNSIRLRYRHGARHVRFASLSGISALWLEDGGRIKGRLRALAKQQQFHAMLGWSGNRQVLIVGEFVAVRDRERTAELLRRSEEDGLERTAQAPGYGVRHAVTGPPVKPTDADHRPSDRRPARNRNRSD